MFKKTIIRLAKNTGIKKKLPNWTKNFLRNFVPIDDLNREMWAQFNPYIGTDKEWGNNTGSKYTLGILVDIRHEHQNYIGSCLELGVSYKVIDIWKNNWIDEVKKAKCDAYLVWPNIQSAIIKQFWDERLYTMVHDLGCKIYPSYDALWLYESKRRSRDFMITHGLPHPKTSVFFNKAEAMEFAKTAKLPLVFKTDQGASAKGVVIVRSRKTAISLVNTCFTTGFALKRADKNDKHRGYVIFQEYLPNVEEWRIIRVHNSYFCRFKIKVGDFHSGSGDIIYAVPPQELLHDIKRITDTYGFDSMNIDYFKTTDDRYLINELHTVFGGKVLPNDELCGRYLYNQKTNSFDFEQGEFFQFRCGVRRVEQVIEKLEKNQF